MTNSQRLSNVRNALNRWLESDAGQGDRITPGSESIVIRGGFYCGRRFNAQSHHALWFLEEDELKIFDSAGQLVCTMHSSEIDRWAGQDEIESAPAAESSSDQNHRRAA
jgi:hypothetical protein